MTSCSRRRWLCERDSRGTPREIFRAPILCNLHRHSKTTGRCTKGGSLRTFFIRSAPHRTPGKNPCTFPAVMYRLTYKMTSVRPRGNTLPTPRPAHAKQHCPDPPKVSPPRTKHSNFPLKSGRSAASSQLRVTSLTSLPYPCDSHSMARPSLIQSLVVWS